MNSPLYNCRGRGLRALAPLVVLLLAAPALEAQTPAPPQAGPIALTGGTVHTVSGEVIPGGTVVFEDGVITAVGREVPVPAGARTIDVSGREVYPGFVDAYSAMGLSEIGAVDVTLDLNELGPFNPNVQAHVAVNPESRHIGVARSNGVLVTVSSPSGGLVSGMAAAMMMEGWTWEEMTLQPDVGLIVNWPSPLASPWGGGQRDPEARYTEEIAELREHFASARAYAQARRAEAAGQAPAVRTDPRLEAMIPVLEGTVPVIVAANELRQLQDAVDWAEREGVRLILRGGRDAHLLADHLAARQVPVLLTSVLDSPSRAWEAYDEEYTLPGRLHRAGVQIAITGGAAPAYANRLPFEAGAAVGFGLPQEAALRAVTLNPARFLGIDDRVGSIAVGRDATLMITTGNPLEYESTVEQVFIQGREVDMGDAQRTFYEKYRQRLR